MFKKIDILKTNLIALLVNLKEQTPWYLFPARVAQLTIWMISDIFNTSISFSPKRFSNWQEFWNYVEDIILILSSNGYNGWTMLIEEAHGNGIGHLLQVFLVLQKQSCVKELKITTNVKWAIDHLKAIQ